MSITVRPIDDSSDAEVDAVEALLRARDDEFLGGHDQRTTAQVRASMADSPYRQVRVLVAEHPSDGVVGVTYLRLGLTENTDQLFFWTAVSPGHRGRGVGGALADAAVAIAREWGRPKILMGALVPSDCDPADPNLPSTRIATRLGLVGCGVDVARAAPLPLSADVLAALAACAHPPRGYRLVSWRGRTPADHVEDVVALVNQLLVDAPDEDKQLTPEVWTAERLVEAEQRGIDSGSIARAVGAVTDDGRLIGYTELGVHDSPGTTIAWQGDTVVAREHRGHGLGLTLKLASHMSLADTGLTSIATWNSQANPWMIAINEALGYRVKALDLAYRSG